MKWPHTYHRPGCTPIPCMVSMDPKRDGRVWIISSVKGKSRPVQREHVKPGGSDNGSV